ncbi:troponin T-like isoform X3 [Odontomachus brunneus]|uniref:troponin T-like isoform X3 n=1 Tax=Odontomachus brunneus TaxID=486640 RepID=UPI0013F194D4|nr:troponin T-like isoform X3 [Odontomachus brunneus]
MRKKRRGRPLIELETLSLRPGLANWHFLSPVSEYRITLASSRRCAPSSLFNFDSSSRFFFIPRKHFEHPATCLTTRTNIPARRKSRMCKGRASQKESGESIEFMKKQEQKRSELDEQLKEYIAEWRKQRSKEEDELKRLKEKQAKRKVTRAEEEKRLAQKKKEEEERRQREIEEKKQRDIEEKRRRLEESEKKRQAMMQAVKEQSKKGPNFTITKKDLSGNLTSAQIERNKTKEQLEEEKKISLSIRIKPLEIEGMSIDKLRTKATELWESIVKLETEKYDLEERQKRQEYDLKELKERQKQQLRHKALKKGLDPEALTGKYPPKIQVASKYERRVDTRSYDDKKKLFEGPIFTRTHPEMLSSTSIPTRRNLSLARCTLYSRPDKIR